MGKKRPIYYKEWSDKFGLRILRLHTKWEKVHPTYSQGGIYGDPDRDPGPEDIREYRAERQK